jgi:hypothetical protein
VTDAIASFAWNLTEVRALHKTLAEEMSREVKAMASELTTTVPTGAVR